MAKGFYLVIKDKTTCGGIITEGDPTHTLFGKAIAREQDRVTCGKHPGMFIIVGHIPGDAVMGRKFAGTLHSKSSCPCQARFNPSMINDTYEFSPAISKTKNLGIQLEPALTQTRNSYTQTANTSLGLYTPLDNRLFNGVYVWTETTGVGHAFVSVHENNTVRLYTYGRYGRTGFGSFTGDGILNFLQDEDAINYYLAELYRLGARAFQINDADIKKTRTFFEKAWNSGTIVIQTSEMKEVTKRRGRTIDEYDVTGSNCTTHTTEGIKMAGSKIFETRYTPMTTQFPIEAVHDFTVPESLQKFLIAKSVDLSSILVIEVTNAFKKQYPYINNIELIKPSLGTKSQTLAVETAAVGDSLSPYSGGTLGGILGGSYDAE